MREDSPDKLYLTPKEAASELGVHEKTVRSWCNNSNPLHAKKIGGVWRIPVKTVRFAESVKA